MTRTTNASESKSEFEDRLRRLDLGDPSPVLRQRTLRDVRTVLDDAKGTRPAQSWIRSRIQPWVRGWHWQAIAMVTSVLVLGLLLLPRSSPQPVMQLAAIDSASMARWLDLNDDLARHVGARLALARTSRTNQSNPTTPWSLIRGQNELDPTDF